MATTETRLLLLGAVAIFEPVNGYQIRRELMSWGVESWANLKPGSIYSGLTTLTQRGDLVRHDLRDGSREVAVYELSDEGRTEFRRLFDEALTEVRPTSPLAFQTALSRIGAPVPSSRATIRTPARPSCAAAASGIARETAQHRSAREERRRVRMWLLVGR